MAKIQVLPQAIADKIAAGEVAERPSSVVKELVENSIDAGADRITVEIKNGGVKYIRVEDNGKGIPSDELEFAFLRHATSKLRDIDDLYTLQTMGFRGEALASICAVSDVEVLTKTEDADEGAYMTLKHGVPSTKECVACNKGTTMIVENLFANIPARMKFLKKDSTESGYIADVLERIALSKPNIGFRLICDGKESFSTMGDGQLKNAILNIYGIECAKGILEVEHTEHGVRVSGVVGKPELARGNRARQTLIVNGRYIKNHVVSKVVEEAYRNAVMVGRFPFFVLSIELSPELVDVNVHPAKTEIKFANEKEIYEIVHRAVRNALYVREVGVSEEKAPSREEKTINILHQESETKPDFSPKPQMGTEKFQLTMQTEKPKPELIREFLKNTMPVHEEKQIEEGQYAFHDSVVDDKKSVVSDTHHVEETENIIGGDTTDNIKIVGQLFDTYVITELDDVMFMIDQHAAHERKRFEKLREDYKNRKIYGQILMSPIVLDADTVEMQVIRDHSEIFRNMGFVIEEFGARSVIIRETPIIADDEEIKSMVLEMTSILRDGRPSDLLNFEERALDMIACRYAIKAHKKLSSLEMEAVVKDVCELEAKGITTCPHGRPIKIPFTKKSIEKMFGRIV